MLALSLLFHFTLYTYSFLYTYVVLHLNTIHPPTSTPLSYSSLLFSTIPNYTPPLYHLTTLYYHSTTLMFLSLSFPFFSSSTSVNDFLPCSPTSNLHLIFYILTYHSVYHRFYTSLRPTLLPSPPLSLSVSTILHAYLFYILMYTLLSTQRALRWRAISIVSLLTYLHLYHCTLNLSALFDLAHY